MKTIAILICADSEWSAIRHLIKDETIFNNPFNEGVIKVVDNYQLVYLHCGYGKIPAAAATQYLIDQFECEAIINLGTCGGFGNDSFVGEVILANQTLNYDIIERMGDYQQAIDHFSSHLDLSKLDHNIKSLCSEQLILSADQDIDPQQVTYLTQKFKTNVADWESAAIAYICKLNQQPIYILRVVSDLVMPSGGEAYNSDQLFEKRTNTLMKKVWDIHSKIIDKYIHHSFL